MLTKCPLPCEITTNCSFLVGYIARQRNMFFSSRILRSSEFFVYNHTVGYEDTALSPERYKNWTQSRRSSRYYKKNITHTQLSHSISSHRSHSLRTSHITSQPSSSWCGRRQLRHTPVGGTASRLPASESRSVSRGAPPTSVWRPPTAPPPAAAGPGLSVPRWARGPSGPTRFRWGSGPVTLLATVGVWPGKRNRLDQDTTNILTPEVGYLISSWILSEW